MSYYSELTLLNLMKHGGLKRVNFELLLLKPTVALFYILSINTNKSQMSKY